MAKQFPKVFYGLHFVSGVAQYENDGDRIYIGEEAAKLMDATFPGKPVYVDHKTVNLEQLQNEADGYVIESFFNPHDGKHWAKFVVVSDAGQEAVLNGWKLSNAYGVKKTGEGGLCHNVKYQEEVLDGVYNHLAIVQNPRYEESIILSPEQFKKYNEEKQHELKLLQNSKPMRKFMFKFFEKKPIENSKEFGEMSVKLKNGMELTVNDLVAMADKKNSDDADADDEKKKKEDEKAAKEKEEKENAAKKNDADKDADDEKKKKEAEEKKNADDKEAKEKEEKMNEIKNAMDAATQVQTVDISTNKIARGKRLYGR